MSLYRWSEVSQEKIREKLSRKLVWGNRIMLAQVFLKKGCVIPAHRHENEQMTYVLSGALKLQLPDREVVVKDGEVLHVPSNIEHSAVALEDTFDLDVFSPVREDWLAGKDDYLRRHPTQVRQ